MSSSFNRKRVEERSEISIPRKILPPFSHEICRTACARILQSNTAAQSQGELGKLKSALEDKKARIQAGKSGGELLLVHAQNRHETTHMTTLNINEEV